jgi:putative membrane protein
MNMKAFPYFLVVGAMMLGTACSSTTETTTDGSTGSGTSTSTNAANGGTSSNVGGTVGDPGSAGTTTTTSTDAAADVTAFMGTFASMPDATFLLTAASSNMMEIQAGQMASQKASNPEVRKYAQMMVTHHMRATQEWKSVALPLGVKMPTVLMPVHQAMVDRLRETTGKNFTEAYMDMMETAHKLDIAMFEVKSSAAETPNVQAFATKTLPMLRSHYEGANKLEGKVD